MDSPFLMRVLASSVNLAFHASSLVRTIYESKDLRIIDKGPNDFQSKADRDAQRCVIQSLLKNFPGLRIIGEEGQLDQGKVPNFSDLSPDVLKLTCPKEYVSVSTEDLVVWVDPLDATKEFTEGLVEHVTILIGLAVKGIPVGGVIAQPFYLPSATVSDQHIGPPPYVTRVVWALVGLGVFGLLPAQFSGPLPYPINPNASKLSLPHKVIVTRSHPSSTLNKIVDAFYPTDVLRLGGCGYKVLMILEGYGHVYVFPSVGTKKWDTCAPEAVLRAAGGKLTDICGQCYNYDSNVKYSNDRGVIATPKSEWLPAYLNCIPKEILAEFNSK